MSIGVMKIKKLRLYLDNCCLNRPFDDLSYDIVRMESEAVLTIIDRCENGLWSFISSDVLFDEISRLTDNIRKQKILLLYQSASINIELTEEIITRAKELERFGIKPYDALHTATAEYGDVDVFLTTDNRLNNALNRAEVRIKVKNPLVWLMEVLHER
jgi:predicted nucleic acid-binding protein